MSYTASSSPGEARATRERLTRIQPGMEVKDAAGARIGTVAYVRLVILARSHQGEDKAPSLARRSIWRWERTRSRTCHRRWSDDCF